VRTAGSGPDHRAARRSRPESVKAKDLACPATRILPVPDGPPAARGISPAEAPGYIPIILVGNIDFPVHLSHARVMTMTYDRAERRHVDLLRVASSRCRIAS